jgi:hypothetical protein
MKINEVLLEKLLWNEEMWMTFVQIFVHGGMGIEALHLLLGYDRQKLSDFLNRMELGGYVYQSEAKFFCVPFSRLSSNAEISDEVVALLRQELLPLVQEGNYLGLVRYEGWEGVKMAYLEVLEEAINTKQPILAIENADFTMQLGDQFVNGYVNQRLSSNVQALVLCPANDSAEYYKVGFGSDLTQVRLLKDFEVGACVNVVGDLVMTFSDNPIQGVLRRDSQEAKTYRGVFRKIWNQD